MKIHLPKFHENKTGLTNIKDSVFEFFEMVEQRASYIMNQETLVRENKHMYRYTLNEIISDESILETFMIKCFRPGNNADYNDENAEKNMTYLNDYSVSSYVLPVFQKLVRLFVTVIVSQFRKDYLRVIKRNKAKALRKRILEKNTKKSLECPNFTFIKADQSRNKDVTHLKLKAIASRITNFVISLKKQN